MRLSKAQARAHQNACRLLKKPVLTMDERIYVLTHWQAGATQLNGLVGAYFTPQKLAMAMMTDLTPGRILDLCAGIGVLAFYARIHLQWEGPCELVCVDSNPAYVEVGRKVVPEARWHCADIFHLTQLRERGELKPFDWVITNPPWGTADRTSNAPRYRGRCFEYHALDIASDLANDGLCLLPQNSVPFRCSGARDNSEAPEEMLLECQRFKEQTGIELEQGCATDTAIYSSEWQGLEAPAIEIALIDFRAARCRRQRYQTADLFAATG